ncbi:hypothetical protein PQO01_01560 [Lentisphaera marina]|nr:hypothetical protein [Lentisphaera marina]MDD7983634.1 hypothetical protein [Lentisphaera marina]
MASFAKLTGASLKENEAVDSYNMLDIFMGQTPSAPVREATVQNTKKDIYAIRRGDWVLLDTSTGHHSGVKSEYLKKHGFHAINRKAPGLLYNLKNDLSQKSNVYDQHPEIVKELKDLLKSYRNGTRSAPILD